MAIKYVTLRVLWCYGYPLVLCVMCATLPQNPPRIVNCAAHAQKWKCALASHTSKCFMVYTMAPMDTALSCRPCWFSPFSFWSFQRFPWMSAPIQVGLVGFWWVARGTGLWTHHWLMAHAFMVWVQWLHGWIRWAGYTDCNVSDHSTPPPPPPSLHSLVFATPLCCALFPQKRLVTSYCMANCNSMVALF